MLDDCRLGRAAGIVARVAGARLTVFHGARRASFARGQWYNRAMPRVKISIPAELLQNAESRAQEVDKSISELFAEAIERYVKATEHATPGSLRSRSRIPRSSPVIAVEIPEPLFETADKLAERLEKRREVLYCEALARHLPRRANATSALDQGHDLPAGAWRPRGTA